MLRPSPIEDNLLVRVSSYTPRVDRNPLEDFCTETLAWCLRKSNVLLKQFIDSLKFPALGSVVHPKLVEVSTQLTWQEEENGEDEQGQDEDSNAGRFDLAIEQKDTFVIVLECKTWAKIDRPQIEKYRREIKNSRRFDAIPLRFLVGLTKYPDTVNGLDRQIRWSATITKLLDTCAETESEARFVIRQFKAFLKEKGLGPMTLDKVIGTEIPSQFIQIQNVEDQFRVILENVARELSDSLSGLRIKMKRRPRREETFYGLSNSGRFEFYLGFMFEPEPPDTKLSLYIERVLPGDHRHRKPDIPELLKAAFNEMSITKEGNTDVVFSKAIDTTLDGKPEQVVRWFVDMSKALFAWEKTKSR